MPSTVSANGLTLVHEQSNGQLITTDVCNTTVGNSVIPIPYVNVAESADAAATASTVYVEGCPVCVETSRLEISRGDEGGDQGGLLCGVREAEATFLAGSPDVFVEGVPVVRAFEQMVSNRENTSPAPLLQDMAAPNPAAGIDPIAGEQRLPWVSIEIAGQSQAPLPGELIVESEQGDWHRSKALNWANHDGRCWLITADELPAGTQQVRLSLLDVDAQHGFVKVPLTLGASQPVCLSEGYEGADSGAHAASAGGDQPTPRLVPLLVRLHTRKPGERRTSGCGFGGWVYLFWEHGGKRYLWRELWLDGGGMVREVNLSYERGDERRATAQPRAVVLVPENVSAEQVKLCAVYSAVQWPWSRVVSYGGLHCEDPRAGIHRGVAEDVSPAALQVDEQRLEYFELSSYAGFCAASLPATGPLGGCDEFVDAIAEPSEEPPLREDLLAYVESGLPVLYLDDPLGQARWLAREQERCSCELAALVASLQTGRSPQAFLPWADHAQADDLDPGSVGYADSDASEGAEGALSGRAATEIAAAELHHVAATLYRLAFIEEQVGFGEIPPDRELLERLLAVSQRAELRRRIAECRRSRLQLLEQPRYARALADYLDNTARRTFAGIAALVEHCDSLAEPAAAADAHLLADDELHVDDAELRQARKLLYELLTSPDRQAVTDDLPYADLLRVSARLLGEPVGLSRTCRGRGVPYSRSALEQQLNKSPPALRDIEGLVGLAEQRRVIQPADGVKLLWSIVKGLAVPASYEHPIPAAVIAVQERLNLPGTELIGPVEQRRRKLQPAVIQGKAIDQVQDQMVAAIRGAGSDGGLKIAGERLVLIPSEDLAYRGVLSTTPGKSKLWVLGNPAFAPGNRIAPVQTVSELVVSRSVQLRLAELADDLVQGAAGQAVRGYLGLLELINLRHAMTEVNGQAGVRQLISAYIATSDGLNLIAEMIEAHQRRRWTVNHPQVRLLQQVAKRLTPPANALGLALNAFDGGRALLERDYLAGAVAMGGGVSLALLGMSFAYLGAPMLLVYGAAVLHFLAMLAYDLLRDGPLGQLYRNGPFTADVRQDLTLLLGAEAPPHVWIRNYAEQGPQTYGLLGREGYSAWGDVSASLSDELLAPPVKVDVDYGGWSAGSHSVRSVCVEFLLPGFDWRAGDGIGLRYLLREACGRTYELFDIAPEIDACEVINQSALLDSGEGLRLRINLRDLDLSSSAMTLMVMCRVDGLTGYIPACDRTGTPRYRMVAVAMRDLSTRRPYRVLTASIEEVLGSDPIPQH